MILYKLSWHFCICILVVVVKRLCLFIPQGACIMLKNLNHSLSSVLIARFGNIFYAAENSHGGHPRLGLFAYIRQWWNLSLEGLQSLPYFCLANWNRALWKIVRVTVLPSHHLHLSSLLETKSSYNICTKSSCYFLQ